MFNFRSLEDENKVDDPKPRESSNPPGDSFKDNNNNTSNEKENVRSTTYNKPKPSFLEVQRTPSPPAEDKPYIPTFMTELKDKKRQAPTAAKAGNESPPLIDFSSDFGGAKTQKPKLGRRGTKPIGTTHLNFLESEDREKNNQSPVMANFSFDTKSHQTLANVRGRDQGSAGRQAQEFHADPFRINDSPSLVIMRS